MLLPPIETVETASVEAPIQTKTSSMAGSLNQLLRRATSSEDATSSPLKILRDKTFPIGKPRLKILPSVGSESVTSTTFLLERDCENPCETPSYMANAGGNFPLCSDSNDVSSDNNPIPLPPRDRNSLNLNVAQKRHVRKYPLIIPSAVDLEASTKTLNGGFPKETPNRSSQLPQEAEAFTTSRPLIQCNDEDDDDDDVFSELRETKISDDIEKNVNNSFTKHDDSIYKKDFIENNFPASNDFLEQRTYENMEIFQKQLCGVDTASINFEEILENDEHVANISDDLVDGFCVFESNSKNTSSKKLENNFAVPAATSAAIESKKLAFSQKYPRYKMPRNELASNALFNKIKESVENASSMEECEVELNIDDGFGLKKSINHVSCEDLLDFSEKKPNGRERGVESDEVRIMIKMFGSNVSSINLKF